MSIPYFSQLFKNTVNKPIHKIYKNELILYPGNNAKKPPKFFEENKDKLQNTITKIIELDKMNIQKLQYTSTQDEIELDFKNKLICDNTSTIRHTGRNNVTYTHTCKPKNKDIIIKKLIPLYLPTAKLNSKIKENTYNFEINSIDNTLSTNFENTHKCKKCDKKTNRIISSKRWICLCCGAIMCYSCKKLDRLTKEPVCTDCAIKEHFFMSKKYFKNKINLEEFIEIYNKMPFYMKLLENKIILIAIILCPIILTLLILSSL